MDSSVTLDWVTVTPTSGGVTISASANDDVDRTRVITFQNPDYNLSVSRNVTQVGSYEYLYDSADGIITDSADDNLKVMK